MANKSGADGSGTGMASMSPAPTAPEMTSDWIKVPEVVYAPTVPSP